MERAGDHHDLVKCPVCSTDNRFGQAHCESCGSRIPQTGGERRDQPEWSFAFGEKKATSFQASLLALEEAGGQVHTLGSQDVIGRLDSCDIPVDDKSISREHARFSRLRDGYVIEDLGSTNGTYVNGERIREAVLLRSGDQVTIGTVKYRYVLDVPKGTAATEAALPAVSDVLPQPEAFTFFNDFVQQPATSSEVSSANEEGEAQEENPIPEDAVPSDAVGPAGQRADGAASIEGLHGELTRASRHLLDLAQQAAEAFGINDALMTQLRQRVDSLEDQLRSNLEHRSEAVVEQTAIEETRLDDLARQLSSVVENPRDVTLLLALAEQAGELQGALKEYAGLRRALRNETMTVREGETQGQV